MKAIFAMAKGSESASMLESVLNYEVDQNSRYAGVRDGEEPMPWVADSSKLAERLRHAASIFGNGFIPRSLPEVDFKLPLSPKGNCKSSLWVALAGPIGKYLLKGLFPSHAVEEVVLEYLDVMSEVWEHEMTVEKAEALVEQTKEMLCKLEVHLPASHLNINRHQMVHMVEGIARYGPVYGWSMFSDERFWKFLTDLMMNVARPAASILVRWRWLMIAFKLAQASKDKTDLLASGMTIDVIQEEGDDTPLYFPQFTDFSGDSWVLKREVVKGAVNMDKRLTHGKDAEPDGYAFKAEVHRCFLNHPELCRSCPHVVEQGGVCTEVPACPTYKQLWDEYMRHVGRVAPRNPKDWGRLLAGWSNWAVEMDKSDWVQDLCRGPQGKMRRFKTYEVGGACFTTYANCRDNEKTRPCVVMMRHPDASGRIVASFGQVQNFLLLPAPGVDPSLVESPHDAWACVLLQCKWYKAYGVGYESKDPQTNLHLVQSKVDDYHPHGDIWPLGALSPVEEVGLLPHWTLRRCMVAVGKRTSFAACA